MNERTWKLVVPCQLYSWFEKEHDEYCFAIESPTFRCESCGKSHRYGRALMILLTRPEFVDATDGKCLVSLHVDAHHLLTRYFESVFSRNHGPCECVFVRCRIGRAVQRKQHTQFIRRPYR